MMGNLLISMTIDNNTMQSPKPEIIIWDYDSENILYKLSINSRDCYIRNNEIVNVTSGEYNIWNVSYIGGNLSIDLQK